MNPGMRAARDYDKEGDATRDPAKARFHLVQHIDERAWEWAVYQPDGGTLLCADGAPSGTFRTKREALASLRYYIATQPKAKRV